MLRGYNDSISQLLIHDLDQLLNYEIDNKSFFLLKNLRIQVVKADKEFSAMDNDIKIKSFAIYIENLKQRFVIDLQEIREILDKIFPGFINYKILINGDNIASNTSSISNTYFILKNEYKLTPKINLSINLAINKSSNFYLEGRKRKIIVLVGIILTTFFLVFTILYFYLKNKADNDLKLYILEEDLRISDQEKNALLSKSKIYKQLNKLFVKKATEIYIQQTIGEKLDNGTAINIPSQDYIFPLCLNDSSYSTIDLHNLILMLKKYFLPYASNVALKIETTIHTISMNCASEVFYQLIFSLIYNLLELMEKQSEQAKLITIKFSKKNIIVNYDSFPLDEERIVHLSDAITEEHMDAFFLSCRKLFRSLTEHHFTYIIKSNDNGQNYVEIIYPKKNPIQQKQEEKIINFSKYYKKR